MLKYLRFNFFMLLLHPFSKMARQRRMATFVKIMQPVPGMRILDLGGQPEIWDSIDIKLNITCLNLPGIAKSNYPSHHHITYLEGDACNLIEFNAGDFDLVFSNSVIEHVGVYEKRVQFAQEVLRLSNVYWIQTPSRYFPIEAHCGMLFWWFYPPSLRTYFLSRWRKKLPQWSKMVESTTIVSEAEIKAIFPECQLRYEYFLLPKSVIAYSTA